MKKLITNLFRTIEQKSKLDLITELLIHGNSTPEAIALFDKVKANFIYEMKQREKQAVYECRLINSIDSKETNPNEIEVNYQLVTPN
jgi:hypothetical protein